MPVSGLPVRAEGVVSESQSEHERARLEHSRGKPMSGEGATRYRVRPARCAVRCQGCIQVDGQPCRGDQENITRSGKYWKGGTRRLEQIFLLGRDDSVICACSDSDWAGCSGTRKSTSGRVLCIGGCMT